MTRAEVLPRAARRPALSLERGHMVGKWTITGAPTKIGHNWYYPCRCECGAVRDVRSCNLLTEASQSCGCTNAERLKALYTKPNNAAAINKIYSAYRDGALKRGYAWELTREQVEALVRQPCHYCGCEESNRYTIRGPLFRHNGIDRADNSKGYTADNVVPCCGPCNRAKLTMSRDDFIQLAIRIAERHSR